MSEKRLTVPEPTIVLYEDGFEAKKDGVSDLGRAADGKKLSDLVEKIAEPMVIAVDAPWGAGKSVFLKCWVGEHIKPTERKTTTVYFDAFQHDYLDDPLIALTLEITKQFEEQGKSSKEDRDKRVKKFKRAAWAVGKGAARIGLSAATFGATEILSDVGDEIAKATSKEVEAFLNSKKGQDEIDQFWASQTAKMAAMDAFREALIALTEPEGKDGKMVPTQKLVIVVDELDRCRPDYALNLLEVIKHFFNVPNVHFVLGVNLTELENSVRARYGAGVNASKYLQKFITIEMRLRSKSTNFHKHIQVMRHFENVAHKIGIRDEWKFDWLSIYLKSVDIHANLSLRDVEKIASLAKICPAPPGNTPAALHLYIGLLILKVVSPETIQKARNNRLAREDVFNIFDLFDRPPNVDPRYDPHLCWRLVLDVSISSLPQYLEDAVLEKFDNQNPHEMLRKIIAESLDAFELNI